MNKITEKYTFTRDNIYPGKKTQQNFLNINSQYNAKRSYAKTKIPLPRYVSLSLSFVSNRSELVEEGKIILEPEAITDTRICQLRNRSILEYLIKWRKLSAEDSTWEDESFIQKHPKLLKRCKQHLSKGEGHVNP